MVDPIAFCMTGDFDGLKILNVPSREIQIIALTKMNGLQIRPAVWFIFGTSILGYKHRSQLQVGECE